jgi:hypothetical protein
MHIPKEDPEWWKHGSSAARLPDMDDAAETSRSLPGATFIVDDDTLWLHIEAPSGGHALLNLAALSDDGSITGRALTGWAEHILKLAAHPK